MEGGGGGGGGGGEGGRTARFLRLLFTSCFPSDDDDADDSEINVNARPRRCKAATGEDKGIFTNGETGSFSRRAAQECVGRPTRIG